MIKLTNSWLRSRQTVKICQKCHVSTDFLILIKTFETGRWCRDKIEISPSRLRLLNRQDKLFEIVKIFSTVETNSLPVSRLRVSIETRSRQIETPRFIFFTLSKVFVCRFSVDWKIFHFSQLIKSYIFSRSKYLIF
jgi:hypothetical protein